MATSKYPQPRKTFQLKLHDQTLSLGKKTQIMGIVNVTPDSFSQDGCLKTGQNPVRQALKMAREGADILDIGGESTRPGAEKISEKNELKRVIPVIETLVQKTNVPISIDTYKPEVAKQALKAGAHIVNCIMGSKPNRALLKAVKDHHAAIILMHIRGTPKNMQKKIQYQDIFAEIIENLHKSTEICLEIGIKSDKIVLDPGIGFGKTVEHNLSLIRRLNAFRVLKKPILMGTSRKSFIGKVLDKDTDQRLYGTLATVCASIMTGAHIVRAHDVKAVYDTVRMTDAILNEERI